LSALIGAIKSSRQRREKLKLILIPCVC